MNFEIATEITLTFYSYLIQAKNIIAPYLIQFYTTTIPLMNQACINLYQYTIDLYTLIYPLIIQTCTSIYNYAVNLYTVLIPLLIQTFISAYEYSIHFYTTAIPLFIQFCITSYNYTIQFYTVILPLLVQLYRRFNYSLNIVAPLTLAYILTRRKHYIIKLITMALFLYASIKFQIFRLACKYIFICIFVKSL
jgi:hypothetical protein